MRIDFKTILKYLRGELDSKEEHQIEREALDDPFLSDAIEGFEQFDSKLIESDVNDLKSSIKREDRGYPWMSIAASIIIIVISGLSIWYFSNPVEEQIAFENDAVEEQNNSLSEPVKEFDEEREPVIADTMAEGDFISEQKFDNKKSQESFQKAKEEELSKPISEPIPDKLQNNEADLDLEISEEELITEIQEEDLEEALSGKIAGVKIEEERKAEKLSVEPSSAAVENFTESDISEKKEIRIRGVASTIPKQKQIKGKVVNESGEGIPGVNVVVTGTAKGTVTDISGNFSIKLDTSQAELTIASIGYETEEIKLDRIDNFVSVQLSEDVNQLSEVVVTGYGSSQDYDPEIILPRPEGGFRALRNHVKDNQQFPEGYDFDKSIVKLIVTIFSDGEIGTIKVDKTDGEEFTKEAIRLLKSGPKWNSGIVDGNPQQMEVKVRIKLKKQD
ncbi:carboxypeptidase-like regulatory domain-containing protein [Mangrovivirga sp. M17]|uniref:Carboxypeptidase-like regulatory domain-containing protein n=1 Tax=Mangrovivirga halotolerans TaxID=2993936 RepID=A0ABT3RPN3_9BACT|nr:carboxypeptidase-like regulatory domain-containing protein [Mangrovivirga halotolerans]MCX2743493.1 carboxypeptidase-like regulatory domain-containing protein [Mangrovivirga halotolerans]